MEVATYCREVCGAKCCTANIPDEGFVTCPRLTVDGSCSVYAERYGEVLEKESLVQVGTFRSRKFLGLDGEPAVRPFWCGHIREIAAAGGLDPRIAEQCAVLHPHLLEDR